MSEARPTPLPLKETPEVTQDAFKKIATVRVYAIPFICKSLAAIDSGAAPATGIADIATDTPMPLKETPATDTPPAHSLT